MTFLGRIGAVCVLVLAGTVPVIGQQSDSENPFELSAAYVGDFFGNVSGGVDQGVRYMDNMDVNLQVNLDELGVPVFSGTTVYVYGLGNQGGSISALAGDVQGVSNIEAENSWRIYEIWAQKKFFLSNSSILVGLYDINAEFNYLNSSQLFLNSSHGLDPTIALSGVLGPSTFPHTSVAARLKINPFKGLVWQTAVLDGVPSDPGNTVGTKIKFREDDGLFLITELSLHSVDQQNLQRRQQTSRISNYLGREIASDNSIGIGGWMYSQKRDVWGTTGEKEYEYGIYALGEYKIADNQNGRPEIHAFGRVGVSNESVSELGLFAGAGSTVSNIAQTDGRDAAGFAVAYAQSSNRYRQYALSGDMESAEINFEWTYRFQVHPYMQLQADVQYVRNPSFASEISDAWVTGLRTIISL